MAKADVLPFRALDDELVKVGRGCISPKARLLAENIRHQFCHRRKGTMAAVYQCGETEVVTPTRHAAGSWEHEWRYLTGYNTRWVRVQVLTLGATSPTPWVATDESRLSCQTSTDAGGDFGHATVHAAPTTTLSTQALLHDSKILEVTENSLEDVTVKQGADLASTLVRILAVVVEEMPVPTVDAAVDTWALPETQWTPGTDIIDTEYDDIPIAMQTLRRHHKKLLWSLGKEVITTRTDQHDAIAGRDGSGNIHRFDLDTSVNRPQTTGTAVTVRVLAEDSVVNNGQVRFVFSGSTLSITNITTGGPAWYVLTGSSIVKGAETLSFQLDQTGAGTLTVYQAEVYEDVEAA